MKKLLAPRPAICYSGFRDGQSPENQKFPSYEEIKADLLILAPHWQSLRLYDCDPHAETTLEVIKKEGFHFDVMLGAYIIAEVSNPNCPWGGVYPQEILKQNKILNEERIQKLISLANKYPDIITSVSAGNEAIVDWTDHLVPVESLAQYITKLQAAVKQPVTFCENYVPWLHQLKQVGEQLDFISIHTYPVWEYKTIEDALAYTVENYHQVAHSFPDKQVVITEAGWATNSNGRGIPPHHVNEEHQKTYIEQLQSWAAEEGVLVYLFEAFDENWKGSDDPLEPEKHWGLFYANRQPKLVMQQNNLGKKVPLAHHH
jgi:exo-beta-1,3-glucanase (GH17 family)